MDATWVADELREVGPRWHGESPEVVVIGGSGPNCSAPSKLSSLASVTNGEVLPICGTDWTSHAETLAARAAAPTSSVRISALAEPDSVLVGDANGAWDPTSFTFIPASRAVDFLTPPSGPFWVQFTPACP